MRVNIYAEELTKRVSIISKQIEGREYTAVRFWLALPATVKGKQYQGPFMHRPGDDDSSAVTFWGKRDLRKLLKKALTLLDKHYAKNARFHRKVKKVLSVYPVNRRKLDRRKKLGYIEHRQEHQEIEDALRRC